MIRDPISEDLDYFIEAGREYTKLVGFDFDEEVFIRTLVTAITSEQVKFFVLDGKAHCIIQLTPSLYGRDIIARVVTTWGKGGTRCLRAAYEWAKEQGATKIIADANLNPKIARVYKELGMKKYDTNYMGDL